MYLAQEMTQMSRPKNNDRCLVTLKDKDGNTVETLIFKKPMLKVAEFLGIKSNLDKGDQILIESEEL